MALSAWRMDAPIRTRFLSCFSEKRLPSLNQSRAALYGYSPKSAFSQGLKYDEPLNARHTLILEATHTVQQSSAVDQNIVQWMREYDCREVSSVFAKVSLAHAFGPYRLRFLWHHYYEMIPAKSPHHADIHVNHFSIIVQYYLSNSSEATRSCTYSLDYA